MLGAMLIHNIQPGPTVLTEQPALFWGLIASMWIGNVMLVILNLPLIGLWVKMISIPYHFLYPCMVLFSVIGAFSLSNSTVDVLFMSLFGVLGYVFRKLEVEPAPLLLAFILGPLMEQYLRRTLLLSQGDPMILLQRPMSAVMLLLAAVLLALVLLPAFKKTRSTAFEGAD